MSLANFHTKNAPVQPIYPTQQDYYNAVGLQLHQPREWDIPNRVPVPRIQPAKDTSHWMSWLTQIGNNTEFRSNGLPRYYLKLDSQATRSLHGDNVDSLLLYHRKWPRRFSHYIRPVPY